MFRSRKEHRDLEAALRANRPVPREDFVASLAERIDSAPQPRRYGSLRLGLAGGLTAAMLVALASFGGLGYAAAGAASAAEKIQRVASPAGPATVERSSAQDQYSRKVTICHRTGSKKNPTQTITVSENAVPAHLRHGDTIGPCSGVAGQQFTAGQGGVAGASGVLGVQTLPFTGLSIMFAFFAGFALLAAGSAIRRAVRER